MAAGEGLTFVELEIASSALSDMVQWVARAVPIRPPIPILAGVSLRCVDDQLIVEASDPDRTLRSRMPARIVEEGRVIVAGKLFAEVARALPSATARCWSTDAELIVECGGLEYRFARLPEQDYPQIECAPDPLGTVDGQLLARAVSQVAAATGRDQLLPLFTGIELMIEDEQLVLTATDRYRMARTMIAWNSDQHLEATTLLVPGTLLTEVCRSTTVPECYRVGWDGPVGRPAEHIGFQFVVGQESREVRARLLSGRLPSMTAILAIPTPLTLGVRTDELRLAVQRVRLTADQRSSIHLSIMDDDQILVSGASEGRASGTAIVALPAIEDLNQETSWMAFNPQYLLDALDTYPSDHLQLRVNSTARTAILHAATEDYEATTDEHWHVVKLMHPTR